MYQTGTHGSVGGRLANQSSASYPIQIIPHEVGNIWMSFLHYLPIFPWFDDDWPAESFADNFKFSGIYFRSIRQIEITENRVIGSIRVVYLVGSFKAQLPVGVEFFSGNKPFHIKYTFLVFRSVWKIRGAIAVGFSEFDISLVNKVPFFIEQPAPHSSCIAVINEFCAESILVLQYYHLAWSHNNQPL